MINLTRTEALTLLEVIPVYLSLCHQQDEDDEEMVADGRGTIFEDLKKEHLADRAVLDALWNRLDAALPDRGPSILSRCLARTYGSQDGAETNLARPAEET